MILTKSYSLDSGIALVKENGEIVLAINEERLSRQKLTSKNPILAEELARSKTKEKIKLIKAGYFNHFGMSEELYYTYYGNNLLSLIPKKESMLEIARKIIIGLSKIINHNRIEHHLCHAASAHYTSGKDKTLIITMDAYGDGYSTTVALGNGRDIKFIAKHKWGETLAQLYARITEYLGFRSHRHEGKITGLAAYGDSRNTIKEFRQIVKFENGKVKAKKFLTKGYTKSKMDEFFKGKSREDVSAGLQRVCEDTIAEFCEYWLKKTNRKDIVLAGGLFANVKLNQRIHELPKVNTIHVFPHMGDGGLALGAALAKVKPKPTLLKSLYLGPSYTDKQIKTALDKSKLNYKEHKNVEKEIALLLSKGKVIARFNGGMEYGPRALGNRSILYQTTDKTVNDWLNKHLKRTEFMPFAPATLWEKRHECYKNIKGAEEPAKYMAITFDCTDKMAKQSPGVVHIDGTARPQLVKKEDNKSYYNIIKEYHKITGIPSIINTSFNIHEEPIVMTPNDAIRAFKTSKLDYLAIGSFIVKQN